MSSANRIPFAPRPGRKSNLDPSNQESALLSLRMLNGLSQKELAEATGLALNDISRFENGRRGLSLDKVLILAEFFGVSCHSILFNDFGDLLARAPAPIVVGLQKCDNDHDSPLGRVHNDEIGENYVYEMERLKLANTPYADAINYNRVETQSRFDILSKNLKGKPVYIKVKTTSGSEDEPICMSVSEYEFLLECMHRSWNYELHRVYYVNDPKCRGRVVYSVSEIFQQFSLTNSYVLRKVAQ